MPTHRLGRVLGVLAALLVLLPSPAFSQSTPEPGPLTHVLPIFQKPFEGEYPLSNFFDHELPFEFTDTNGYLLTAWGERTSGIDGHNGYDWRMPEGTPLLAVADGEVVTAGQDPPFDCPLLKRQVIGTRVIIEHKMPELDLRLRSVYLHLSQIDVSVGQQVARGQPIGLSGNEGCSTTPHLHFEARRFVPDRNIFPRIDPYGWESSETDPWSQHRQGAESLWLWQEGQAPALFREATLAPNPGPNNRAAAVITRARWMGWRDDAHPNDELIEISADPRFAPGGVADLTGYKLRNTAGDTFDIPDGTRVRDGQPLHVYSGTGQNSETVLYWGREQQVWSNFGEECVRLIHPSGGIYRLRLSGPAC